MFALRQTPAERMTLAGRSYRLQRVFKHDFWAATCLYVREDEPDRRIVVKFGRGHPFCGFPLQWYGEMLRKHEGGFYRRLRGIEGVPEHIGDVGPCGFAIEYIDARPLDHLDAPPPGFFDRLRRLMDAIHARGVAYCDANKRSNILVDHSGGPWLIDYQISLRTPAGWPRSLGALACTVVRYLQAKDIYHIYKHKRRLAPDELTAEEEVLSRRRSGLHLLHRRLTKPYRALRRRLLRIDYEAGSLRSPTATLEHHHQPEKSTWRSF